MSRDLSVVGRALAAPVRSTIVTMLLDGSTRPASELAASAGVSASTASEHLSVLLETGLLRCVPRGRQRFYAIRDAEVAGALEQLGLLCPPAPVTSYRQSAAARSMAHARLCYDHLAGRLGTRLARAVVGAGWLTPDLDAVTPAGRHELAARDVDVAALSRRRRPLVRACPDWTERHPHVAGAVGAAIATSVIEHGWAVPSPHGRGLRVPDAALAALAETWDVHLEEPDADGTDG